MIRLIFRHLLRHRNANATCSFQFAGGYNHLRSPVCQDESQRDETSPPPHSHSTQPPTSHSSTPNSNNNNNNNNNANNAYIHLRNLNQLKTECKFFTYVVCIWIFRFLSFCRIYCKRFYDLYSRNIYLKWFIRRDVRTPEYLLYLRDDITIFFRKIYRDCLCVYHADQNFIFAIFLNTMVIETTFKIIM